jgi:hypothetical protein
MVGSTARKKTQNNAKSDAVCSRCQDEGRLRRSGSQVLDADGLSYHNSGVDAEAIEQAPVHAYMPLHSSSESSVSMRDIFTPS